MEDFSSLGCFGAPRPARGEVYSVFSVRIRVGRHHATPVRSVSGGEERRLAGIGAAGRPADRRGGR